MSYQQGENARVAPWDLVHQHFCINRQWLFKNVERAFFGECLLLIPQENERGSKKTEENDAKNGSVVETFSIRMPGTNVHM
jgi:hypothetical protein